MNSVYDILEICLAEVDNGMEPEKVLARYPDHADELRPILQASMDAKRMTVPAPSAEVLRRHRAKLLQHAAQIREDQPVATKPWFPSLQRLALTLALLILFFISGTRLARASSSALPGDGLYSVKRSWENVVLFFTFDAETRDALEIEFENERLDEINDLFASGRSAEVDFSGIVTRQSGDEWRVADILVIVSEKTNLPDQPVDIGAAVRVIGTTSGNGIVLAEQIELLPAGAPLPEVEDDATGFETEEPQATSQPDDGNTNSGTETEAPEIEVTITPSPVSTPQIVLFEGILNSINVNIWVVNNILVDVLNAEINGVPVIGALVKAEGYYKPDGVFVAIKIEIVNNGSSNDNVNSNTNADNNTNTNDNGDDDNGNSNSNDDNDNNVNDDNSNDNNDNGNNGNGG